MMRSWPYVGSQPSPPRSAAAERRTLDRIFLRPGVGAKFTRYAGLAFQFKNAPADRSCDRRPRSSSHAHSASPSNPRYVAPVQRRGLELLDFVGAALCRDASICRGRRILNRGVWGLGSWVLGILSVCIGVHPWFKRVDSSWDFVGVALRRDGSICRGMSRSRSGTRERFVQNFNRESTRMNTNADPYFPRIARINADCLCLRLLRYLL
jgi:hypothetical protein